MNDWILFELWDEEKIFMIDKDDIIGIIIIIITII
jgi:hypothetical protein